MLKAMDIAKWFLSKDVNGNLFDKSLMQKNGRTFYSGNARLNKYLHLSQNIYIAKYGEPLFSEHFYAYDNGAVVENVQKNYGMLVQRKFAVSEFDEETNKFLTCFFECFKSAPLDELIELSHEDIEWKRKSIFFSKEDQEMDTISNISVYKEQYKDIIEIMDEIC